MSYGPKLPISQETHAEKYRLPGESFEEAMRRVAVGLSDDSDHFVALESILLHQRFMPGGRVQAAIGSPKDVTAYNCFVSGTIDDSFVEGAGSIMSRLRQAAATMRKGGGIGYDFSTLRPEKATIRKLMSVSCGPIPFIKIFDANGRCISSAGHRRGAQMGVMRVDHPNIRDFIRMKQPPAEAAPVIQAMDACEPGSQDWASWYSCLQKLLDVKGFNVSVALTDEFMECVQQGSPFNLRFGGKIYETIEARELWELMMRSTWDWAEPGALFIDTINRMNNLWYCEQIAATNPCGEQPLPPFGACLLGSFNLVKYIATRSDGTRRFDFDQLRADIRPVVRAMDNVVDRTRYPLREQEAEAQSKRRMGLGVTGLANALEALGHPYGSTEFLQMQHQILSLIARWCYIASTELAQEKGSFPLLDVDKFLQSGFMKTMDEEVRDLIRHRGIRNSHLLSIAPTGTISLSADNVSSSIEPVFAYQTERKINMPGGIVTEVIPDYGVAQFDVRGKRCSDVTVAEHLAVLETATRHVDSAVSKTCNVPADTRWSDFENIYMEAWRRGCKGITTYQVGGRRAGILKSADESAEKSVEICHVDPETGARNCE
jgi:ribonucleoside-diphosphate reductase alpha chain